MATIAPDLDTPYPEVMADATCWWIEDALRPV
jgi:hypothetical protein